MSDFLTTVMNVTFPHKVGISQLSAIQEQCYMDCGSSAI